MKMRRPTLSGTIRNDNMGSGVFGAPRDGRAHEGTDYRMSTLKEPVFAPISGRIIRKLQVYPDSSEYVGCEIRGDDGVEVKLFYMEPHLYWLRKKMEIGEEIGIGQDVGKRYGGGMRAHVHMEVRINGVLVDPEKQMEG